MCVYLTDAFPGYASCSDMYSSGITTSGNYTILGETQWCNFIGMQMMSPNHYLN